jgi:hypothetical protein
MATEGTKNPEKDKLEVQVTIQFKGHITKQNMEEFVTGIRTTVFSNMENGGGGN